eukprot:gnl/Hemi2/9138_TR3175_c0_g1_i1.p1 gnl/Hemi2/9138_TR3175_c0_g1~~gnl/Hemi2/9138_TR3175_c0_g1_i1.p1  ORF type:complete len:747 (-),score=177.76 gnl/Hemi2/9138_TR3175_c0_g1_i1:70-2289(-)
MGPKKAKERPSPQALQQLRDRTAASRKEAKPNSLAAASAAPEVEEELSALDEILFGDEAEEETEAELREKYGYAGLLAATVGAVYVASLHPSVPGGDSGELITAAYKLGAAHPPGYPLFTLIGHLFTFLPYGSVAWRVNLSSAFSGVLASLFFYFASVRFFGSHPFAFLSSALFSLSPLVWTYSIQAEVFPLNNAILSALIYLTIRYEQERGFWVAFFGSLFLGLGACNQHTYVFYAIPFMAFVLFRGYRRLVALEPMSFLEVGLLIGLSPYLQLIYASNNQVEGSWGDCSTPRGFMDHFLRTQYGTFSLGAAHAHGHLGGASELLSRLALYAAGVSRQSIFGSGIWFFAVLGCLVSLASKLMRPLGILFFGSFALYVLVFNYLSNLPLDSPLYLQVQERFWMQANLMVFLWLGLGLFVIVAALTKWCSLPRWVVAAAVIVLVAAHIHQQYPSMDQHSNVVVRDYAAAILGPLPQDALLLVKGDVISNSVHYLRTCEGVRSDVTVIDLALLTFEWFHRIHGPRLTRQGVVLPGRSFHPYMPHGYSMLQFLDANQQQFEIFLAGGWYPGDDSHLRAYTTVPFGLGERVVAATAPRPNLEKWLVEFRASLPAPSFPPAKYPNGSWEDIVRSDLLEAFHKVPYQILMRAIEAQDDAALLERSVLEFRHLRDVVAVGLPLSLHVHRNFGIAAGRLLNKRPSETLHKEMIEHFEKYIELAEASGTTDKLDEIKSIVRQHGQRKK